MRKILRKSIIYVCILTLILSSFVGCGKKPNTSNQQANNNTQQENTSENETGSEVLGDSVPDVDETSYDEILEPETVSE